MLLENGNTRRIFETLHATSLRDDFYDGWCKMGGNDSKVRKFIFYNSVVFINSNKIYYFLLFAVSSCKKGNASAKGGSAFGGKKLLYNPLFPIKCGIRNGYTRI